MTKLHIAGSAALLATALIVSACSNPGSPDAPDAPQTPDTPSASASSVGEDRPSKDEILADFNAALERAQQTQGAGSPALWTLADDDTTIHIFGTVHLLRPDLNWRTDAFNTAFESADTIVFEVDRTSEAAQRAIMTDYIQRGVFDDGRTLTGVLNDADEAVISEAFDSIGVPIVAMNTFEPWMASVNLGVLKLTNDGYDPSSGVESVLEAEAIEAQKSFGYLEQISDQTDAFDLLPEDIQIGMLYETALMLDDTPRMLDLLVDEWADGDIAGIAALVADPEGPGNTGEAYEALLVKRNQAWVPQIEAMLETPGTTMIAVGAGHMAGPDSVITMLRDRGYTVTGP